MDAAPLPLASLLRWSALSVLVASAALQLLAPRARDAAGAVAVDAVDAVDAAVDDDAGTDADGCPPGLSPDEEAAWAFAHLPPVVVTPAARQPGDTP